MARGHVARGGDGMKRIAPPSWLEGLLKSLLPERDREAVSGDLYEEFCEEMVPRAAFSFSAHSRSRSPIDRFWKEPRSA